MPVRVDLNQTIWKLAITVQECRKLPILQESQDAKEDIQLGPAQQGGVDKPCRLSLEDIWAWPCFQWPGCPRDCMESMLASGSSTLSSCFSISFSLSSSSFFLLPPLFLLLWIIFQENHHQNKRYLN